MNDVKLVQISDAVKASFSPVVEALPKARAELASNKNVLALRPGYDYGAKDAPAPALVIAVTPGTTPVSGLELSKKYGVPVAVTDATLEEQLAKMALAAVSFGAPAATSASPLEQLLTGDGAVVFAPPKTGSYEPPDPPNLPLVKERMQLTICVSPEAGWSELETFLGATQKGLTVAMYQFTAPHIFESVDAAVKASGHKFELVLHPVPENPPSSGVKKDDLKEVEQVIDPLTEELKSRFAMAWATLNSKAHPDGLWASAYHIKVAVRDSEVVWLSSGNWQSSNQPNVHIFGDNAEDPPAGFQRKYNRDYHAIFASKTLASIFEGYIRRDHDLAAEQAGGAQSFAAPQLFVPEEAETPVEFAKPPQFFEPLRLDRVVSVQPLLTPDNYAEHALALIKSATKSVWFQNQYINFRGTDEDFPEFKMLVSALKDQVDAGCEVRIICRDMMKEESLDVLIALGFPKEVFRFQPACHNKTIIVDSNKVMFGSHNWSNEGVKTNRDASVIFDDEEIARYLAQVYEYDWERLATAHPTKARPRVARDDEETPAGFQRADFSAVFED
jgi:hypothetical protein